jgi:hypothetical protein
LSQLHAPIGELPLQVWRVGHSDSVAEMQPCASATQVTSVVVDEHEVELPVAAQPAGCVGHTHVPLATVQICAPTHAVAAPQTVQPVAVFITQVCEPAPEAH